MAVTSFTVVVPRPSSANPTAATDTIRARSSNKCLMRVAHSDPIRSRARPTLPSRHAPRSPPGSPGIRISRNLALSSRMRRNAWFPSAPGDRSGIAAGPPSPHADAPHRHLSGFCRACGPHARSSPGSYARDGADVDASHLGPGWTDRRPLRSRLLLRAARHWSFPQGALIGQKCPSEALNAGAIGWALGARQAAASWQRGLTRRPSPL